MHACNQDGFLPALHMHPVARACRVMLRGGCVGSRRRLGPANLPCTSTPAASKRSVRLACHMAPSADYLRKARAIGEHGANPHVFAALVRFRTATSDRFATRQPAPPTSLTCMSHPRAPDNQHLSPSDSGSAYLSPQPKADPNSSKFRKRGASALYSDSGFAHLWCSATRIDSRSAYWAWNSPLPRLARENPALARLSLRVSLNDARKSR